MAKHRKHHEYDGNLKQEAEATEHEQIEVLAYQYWQERGSPSGSAEEDWLRAEKEIQRRNELATRL